jgi:ribokinase
MTPVRVAVVGHVEWVEFLRVPAVPAAGDIVHASDVFAQAAGGGGVASVQLRKLAGSCVFFTALGDDDVGRRAAADLESRGVELRVAWHAGEAQRRAVTFVDDLGERTITVLGERLAPRAADDLGWDDLADFDAVYLTAADREGVRAARQARALVATSRVLPLLVEAGVQLDVLVGSSRDQSERYVRGDLEPVPRYAVMTAGASGGTIERRDWGTAGPGDAEPAEPQDAEPAEPRDAEPAEPRDAEPAEPRDAEPGEERAGGTTTFAAAELPGPIRDAYGAGDSFAAGVTYGLGAGMTIEDAVAMGARCGAHNMTGRGAYEGQLEL